MTILTGYILTYLYLFGVILFVGLLQKLFRFDKELSRKLVHFLIGFVWLILHHFFAGTWHFAVIPFSFVIINYLSYKFKIFKMFERDDGEKNSYGTVFYAASIAVMAVISMFLPQTLLPSGVAVFCLSFGDAAAALAGEYIKKGNIPLTKTKSLFGTLAGIAASILGVFLFIWIIPMPLQVWHILLIGVATGLLELVGHGLDNFTIPFGVMALTTLLLPGA